VEAEAISVEAEAEVVDEITTSTSLIKTTGKKNDGKFNIPGWNSVVKSKHRFLKQPSGYG